MIIIDTPVIDKCWNLRDSYGEICVHCGCCSKIPSVRAKARYEWYLEWLNHLLSFNEWSDDETIMVIQETNIATDLRRCRAQLRYYKKRLDEEERKTQAAPVSTELGMAR